MNIVAPVLPGETLGGKYRVDRILGQGGMGVVVGAKHIDLDERVAIKFLLGEPSSAAVDRFLREARAAVKVKGEHVCRVLDFGRLETGEPYIVMEHLEGTDLAKKIDKEGAQPIAAAVGWIIEASDALAEAHALGIVHRDVKPANIFLARRRDGSTTAKVLDFGISKLASNAQLTGTQSPMGSPSYMSPEQMVSAHDVDARTDIWSLGITLYELLAGKPPFVADSIVQLSVLVRERVPPRLDGVPEGLASVVARCLAKSPEDRYDSVAALVADLAPFAPEDTSGLVRRHALRASTTPPADAAALAATAPDVSRAPRVGASPEPPDDLRQSTPPSGPGTFAPLQSTLGQGRVSTTRRRAWPWLALAAPLLGAITVAGTILSRSAAPAPSAQPLPEAATSAEPAQAMHDAGAAVPAATASVAPPIPTATSLPSGAARVVVARPRPLAPPVLGSAPTMQVPAAPASVTAVPASAAVPPAPPKAPDPRKRRELDREDP